MSHEVSEDDGVYNYLKKIGYYNVLLGDLSVSWTKNNIREMKRAQEKFGDFMISSNFVLDDKVKDAFRQLHNDITEYHTSTCSVCGDKQSIHTHMNVEHLKMEMAWGYESTHDTERHKLTLCNECYDEHILKGSLGKYVMVTNYM